MALYFYVHDAGRFHQELRPALAASWQRRSFEPCRALVESLAPAVRAFAERFRLAPDETLLTQFPRVTGFDRGRWRHLVGEVLLLVAADVPEIPTAPEELGRLLGGTAEHTPPILQAHFGSRDLVFGGGYYRPGEAGWNDGDDVARLADWLGTVREGEWQVEGPAACDAGEDAEDREAGLEYARECLCSLRQMYERAAGQGQLVVSEEL